MAQGHMIPMIDMARLFANHGVIVTIVTTPLNAFWFKTIIDRAIDSGLPIRLLQLRFPCVEARLPEGCESMDTIPSRESVKNFFIATSMLQQPLEQLLGELQPHPSCIISDMLLPWTSEVARLPDRIEMTRAQLPSSLNKDLLEMKEVRNQGKEAELISHGVVVNSFEELEPGYVEEYKKAKGEKVFCIGSVSLCNKEILDKAERGNKASIDGNQCLNWLDSKQPSSVVYACLGSHSPVRASQLIEIGLGLEASNRPFIWAIEGGDKSLQVGVEVSIGWGEEEKAGGLVKREEVKKAVEQLMDEGEQGEERRKRASELGEMAKRALEVGGSSHFNMTLLIQDIMHQVSEKQYTQD
ncbi:hypothetical protein HHK36_019237 [Tetracentron sinense]|uniref:Uncharacterized protein n=1 Tax=Tetracentron sinense TaxID=13715 RepID=A0A834YTM1_TETSI|nr:hypothetical protein HHK36_019237 [Tetracentron sinense]